MNKHRLGLVGLTVIISFALGCSHGQCHNLPQRETASESQPPSEGPAAAIEKPATKPADAVTVFKDSGEKQCGMAKAIPLEKVQAVLVRNKIKVYDSHTGPDGLMHTQVCGAPSGMIHVFSIPEKSLKKAESLGFKRWHDVR